MEINEPRTPNPAPRKVFIVAGEVSGDIQASHVAAELRRRDPTVDLVGVGGPSMLAAGVSILHESSTWGAIGYVDPLLQARTYLRRLRQVEEEVRHIRPDVLLLVDFTAFNLRLAERLRGGVPVVYYFPPMVSVRRGERARRIARLGMRILATLRREADAYLQAGADVMFVGHPVVDLARPRWDPQTARAQFEIPAESSVIGLLPGSRIQEIRAHLPVMLRAAQLLHQMIPALWFVLPVPTPQFRQMVEKPVAESGLPVRIVSEVYDAMAISRVLVAATGTATLEGAVLGIPMVAVYRLPWLSWVIATRVVSVAHAALPNILAGREVVPELLQHRMTPQAIADEVRRLWDDEARREAMRAGLRQVVADLGPPGAVARAAGEILAVLLRGPVASPERGG